MRTILFKAKSRAGGAWIIGYYYSDGTTHHIIPQREEGPMFFDIEIDPETLCEFTGETLRGKDLYEGDIVDKENNYPRRMMIAFIEGAFCLAAVEEIRDEEGKRVLFEKGEYIMDIHYIHHAGREQAEIVGNIHDEVKP